MTLWQKSSYSGEDKCVEVALGPAAKIRDTKDRSGGTLEISTRSWDALLSALCRPTTLDLPKV
ncbi:DUF397 domain-containing protein [Amycolatopsis sp. DG1A-15b]|uniref:DUF397 domain-containing protein n=1 Tax=Amycolatopsis sp. DG1A-15b TaxID=3052846 RepID=UPI00255BD643|nr:DUF397 domain-containing protein [Amycolatopsis sp. DG1A-15b]WIX92739.1 DUF397 domain-containing protein [Amycolatopsis sp. DG1A-15b]